MANPASVNAAVARGEPGCRETALDSTLAAKVMLYNRDIREIPAGWREVARKTLRFGPEET
jgi:hypothetical protein